MGVMLNFKLKVTQEDIDNGKQGCNISCPIALALRKYLNKSAKDVSVTAKYFRVWPNRFSTTPEIEDFIGRFDFGGKHAVKPTEFDFSQCYTLESPGYDPSL